MDTHEEPLTQPHAHTCHACGKGFATKEALEHHHTAKHQIARYTHQKSRKPIILVGIIILIIIVGIGIYAYSATAKNYDAFAQCISAKGAKFYGAFWCPHCKDQKAMFGNSKAYLPYIECSTDDGQHQLPVCDTANISGYPTWVFPDGSRISGALELTQLSDKTSCALP